MIIYQVYPPSFKDSGRTIREGEYAQYKGWGDLKGITEKLDYIKGLEVDAIWICPFYPSPHGPDGDGGYAVTHYEEVDPRFGTMEDFKELLQEAHKRGLQIYTDFVLCHTSHQHKWFQASRDPHHRDYEKYKDFYVWGYPQPRSYENPEGLPTNWQSVFNGKPAWTEDLVRKQYNIEHPDLPPLPTYYLHHFNTTQPALNFSNDKVQEASLAAMRFWRKEVGVDGLRVDAVPYLGHTNLVNNGPRGHQKDDYWQYHWYSQDFNGSFNESLMLQFIERMRKELDGFLLGELIAGPWGGDGDMQLAAKCVGFGKFDSGYPNTLTKVWGKYPSAESVKNLLRDIIKFFPNGNICSTSGTHDSDRLASRIMGLVEGDQGKKAPYEYHDRIIKQFLALLFSLPGDISLYQGDELGCYTIPSHQLNGVRRDVIEGQGNRDGARGCIPWEWRKKNAGFTDHDAPFLPIPEGYYALAVDRQEGVPGSILEFVRGMIRQRKANPALSAGELILLEDTPPDIVAFARKTDEQIVLCCFNMSDKGISFDISKRDAEKLRTTSESLVPGGKVHIGAYTYSHAFHPSIVVQVAEHIGHENGANLKNSHAVNGNGHKTRVFTVDTLIADIHSDENGENVARGLAQVLQNHGLKHGGRAAINNEEHSLLENASRLDAYLAQEIIPPLNRGGELTVTVGGTTLSTLSMVKGCLGEEVEISFMGIVADDEYGYGRRVREFLSERQIHLLTEGKAWPSGIKPETAVSHIIRHKDIGGRSSVLTYLGGEIEALLEIYKAHPEMLEKGIKGSHLVYLPDSSITKLGVTLTNRILELRREYKKELVLALPSSADFGPDDRRRFKDLIPECNIVMGNDLEFCHTILGQELTRPIGRGQMKEVIDFLQKGFKEERLKKTDMPCSEYGQAAFITCGNDDAILVTKDLVLSIPTMKIGKKNVVNPLGVSEGFFTGVLVGYLKGLPHEQSAILGMALAAEKLKQKEPHPYLIDPQASLNSVLKQYGMWEIGLRFAQGMMPKISAWHM